MSESFSDFHEVHHIGNMDEHAINGSNVSTGIRDAFSEHYSTPDGVQEWVVKTPHGGADVYHNGSLYEKVIPTGHGHHDIYDSQMHLKGSVIPNIHHGHDVMQGANLVDSSLPLGHGASTVMHYSDPLAHFSEHVWTKLIL